MGRTVPQTLRNPLYHWTHLELKRYFGIDNCSINRAASAFGTKPTRCSATTDLRPQGIMRKFR